MLSALALPQLCVWSTKATKGSDDLEMERRAAHCSSWHSQLLEVTNGSSERPEELWEKDSEERISPECVVASALLLYVGSSPGLQRCPGALASKQHPPSATALEYSQRPKSQGLQLWVSGFPALSAGASKQRTYAQSSDQSKKARGGEACG